MVGGPGTEPVLRHGNGATVFGFVNRKGNPMQIESIIRAKGAGVATISHTASIHEASKMLASRQVGALVVSPDGETIDGILSERDIARALAEHGAATLDLTVGRLMTSEVTTCARTDSVDRLMEVMTAHRIRHIPVVDGGKLFAIVSIGDIVKTRLDELQTETQTLHDYITLGR